MVGSSAFINLLLTSAVCRLLLLVYRKKLPARDSTSTRSNLHCFSYTELVQATNGFEEELGRGSFGIVYKGVMDSIIAVKKLDRVVQDSEGIQNRSECDRADSPQEFGGADWILSQIALGIARGLAYLHEECSTQIIHCDIKPQNILLDEHHTARIADFGLAKLLAMNQSKTQTNIRGTKGYVAPEWFKINAQITVKVDVYSFGVVLLEIISCRKILEDLEFGGSENPILTDWAWDCFLGTKLDVLVKNDEEALEDRETLERFVMVGLWCIQEDASLRPTMRTACQMLQGIVQVPLPPSPSSFTSVA